MTNSFRGEIAFPLGDKTVAVRPTLQKIAEIETVYGSAVDMLDRLFKGTFKVTEVIGSCAIILRGQAGLPQGPKLMDYLFDEVGVNELVVPLGQWINAAGDRGRSLGEANAGQPEKSS